MQLTFAQSVIVSIIFHGIILFTIIPSRRNVIYVPLSVELIKISRPQKKHVEVEEEAKKVKEKKKKILERSKKKKDEIKTSQNIISKPQATTRITLEAAKFPYLYYLAMIRKKVATHWDWPHNTGTFKTVVYFRIIQSGEMVNVKLEEKSKDELFDHAALRAIKLSSPFSPLPGGFTEDYLGVFFEFSFKE